MFDQKRKQILELVSEYYEEKRSKDTWNPGTDWVSYSGLNYDKDEILAAVKVILDDFSNDWVIFGKNNILSVKF